MSSVASERSVATARSVLREPSVSPWLKNSDDVERVVGWSQKGETLTAEQVKTILKSDPQARKEFRGYAPAKRSKREEVIDSSGELPPKFRAFYNTVPE
jgi:hypothetical protein